jgi:hypothetical protein
VGAIIDTALQYMQQGQMTAVLRVIAPTLDAVEEQAVPLTWAKTPEFDASLDYPRALAKLLWNLGLIAIHTIPDSPLSPASYTNSLAEEQSLDGPASQPASGVDSVKIASPNASRHHMPHTVTPDLKGSGDKSSVSDTVHSENLSSLDRPIGPSRKPYVSLRSPFFLLSLAILLILVIGGGTVFMHQSSTPVNKSGPSKLLATIQTATPTTHATAQASSKRTPAPAKAQASPTQVPAPTATPTAPTKVPAPTQVPPTRAPAPTPTASTSNSAPTYRASGSYTKWWATTFGSAPGYIGSQRVGTLYAATNYMFCKAWAGVVTDSSGNYNHWWLWTDLDTGGQGWVSAYYLSKWGNDEAKDNNGNVIPNC